VESSSSDDDELINRMVNISSFTKGEDVLQSFPCTEMKDDYSTPRCVQLQVMMLLEH